jgi:hypothetical protein
MVILGNVATTPANAKPGSLLHIAICTCSCFPDGCIYYQGFIPHEIPRLDIHRIHHLALGFYYTRRKYTRLNITIAWTGRPIYNTP